MLILKFKKKNLSNTFIFFTTPLHWSKSWVYYNFSILFFLEPVMLLSLQQFCSWFLLYMQYVPTSFSTCWTVDLFSHFSCLISSSTCGFPWMWQALLFFSCRTLPTLSSETPVFLPGADFYLNCFHGWFSSQEIIHFLVGFVKTDSWLLW